MKDFNSKEKLHLLVDCDPGADDVFALLWLLINHKFSKIPMEIIWITTVWGNVAADKTYENVLRIREMVGVSWMPIWKDHRQIVSEDASYIHGDDGIGNLGKMLPPVHCPEKTLDSVEMVIDALEKNPNEVIIIATWPLTNLALAEEKKSWILKQAKKLLLWEERLKCNEMLLQPLNLIYSMMPKVLKKFFLQAIILSYYP